MTPIDHSADWRTKLTQALGGVSDEDHEQLIEDAGDWPTCACNKSLGDWIERDEMFLFPIDSLLTELGTDFFDHVCSNRFDEALTTLDAIEARAQELKP